MECLPLFPAGINQDERMLSLFGKKKWKPDWVWNSPGVIWRFILSESDLLVIENREKEKKQVSFSAIRLSDGKTVWEGVRLADSWFAGMETVVGDRVYLHGYLDPKLPEHAGVYALNLSDGQLLWYHPDLAFYHAGPDTVWVYDPHHPDRLFTELDPQTGHSRRKLDPGNPEPDLARRSEPDFPGFLTARFPDKCLPGQDGFDLMSSWITTFSPGLETAFGLDILDLGTTVLIGFHVLENQNRRYDLVQADPLRARITRQTTLSTQLTGQAGDLFLVRDGILLTVKERNQLAGFRLTDSQ